MVEIADQIGSFRRIFRFRRSIRHLAITCSAIGNLEQNMNFVKTPQAMGLALLYLLVKLSSFRRGRDPSRSDGGEQSVNPNEGVYKNGAQGGLQPPR